MNLLKITEIKENPNNPRTITKRKFKELVNSIRDFPEMLEARPIVVNPDNVILGGNQRYKAAKFAGLEKVPVYVASWDEIKSKEFVIKDNVSFGDWDWDMLANEWEVEELNDWGVNTPDILDIEKDDIYSKKINAPLYEAREIQPEIEMLYDDSKYKKLIQEIEESDLSDGEKEFLKIASARHIVFYFDKIADYYSHCSKAQQDLFEKNALVIIDFQKAIRNGYVELQESVYKQYEEDYE